MKKLIPTPNEYIQDTEFVKQYKECFDAHSPNSYTLKKEYVFQDWNMVLCSGNIIFNDEENGFLTGFVPLISTDAKYYLLYGQNITVMNFSEIDEERFTGFHKFDEGDTFTALSVSKNQISTYLVTIGTGGNIPLPI